MKSSYKQVISDEIQEKLREELMEYELKKVQGEEVPGVGQFLHSVADRYKDANVSFYIARNNYYGNVKGMFDDYKEEPKKEQLTLLQNTDEELTTGIEVKEEPKSNESLTEKSSNTLSFVTEKKETRKGVVKPSYNIDESIDNFINSTSPSTRKKLSRGDKVDVRVNAIRHYGVLVETVDGLHQGLIHISSVRDEFINDLNVFFSEGDIIKDVKVIKVEKDGKLSLSTRDNKLIEKQPEPQETEYKEEVSFNPIADKLAGFKDQLIQFNQEPLNTTSNYTDEGVDTEIDEMVAYIRGIVGALSPEAENLVKEVREKHKSIFKMTRAILEVEKDFAPDLSLLFMKQVLGRLDGGL